MKTTLSVPSLLLLGGRVANGQDGMYVDDECRCDDPFGLYWCYVHGHWANHDGKCSGRCFTQEPAEEPEQ